jgi:hypothetical protein
MPRRINRLPRARPAPDAVARPAPDAVARPAPDAVARPAPDAAARPAPDAAARPAPDAVARPVPDEVLRRLADLSHVRADQHDFFFGAVRTNVQTAFELSALVKGGSQTRKAQHCYAPRLPSMTC